MQREALALVVARPVTDWRRVEPSGGPEAALAIAFELCDFAPSPVTLTLRTIGGPLRNDRSLTSLVLHLRGFMLRALGEATLAEGLRSGTPSPTPVRFANRADDSHDLAALFRRLYAEAAKPSWGAPWPSPSACSPENG